MRTVIAYGTFDVLYFGRVYIIRLEKNLGNRFFVGLSIDDFNLEKSKRSLYGFEEREVVLESIEYVDLVMAEYFWGQKIVNVFVMGGDWCGGFDYLNGLCEVVCFDRTEGISSTIVKQRLTCR